MYPWYLNKDGLSFLLLRYSCKCLQIVYSGSSNQDRERQTNLKIKLLRQRAIIWLQIHCHSESLQRSPLTCPGNVGG